MEYKAFIYKNKTTIICGYDDHIMINGEFIGKPNGDDNIRFITYNGILTRFDKVVIKSKYPTVTFDHAIIKDKYKNLISDNVPEKIFTETFDENLYDSVDNKDYELTELNVEIIRNDCHFRMLRGVKLMHPYSVFENRSDWHKFPCRIKGSDILQYIYKEAKKYISNNKSQFSEVKYYDEHWEPRLYATKDNPHKYNSRINIEITKYYFFSDFETFFTKNKGGKDNIIYGENYADLMKSLGNFKFWYFNKIGLTSKFKKSIPEFPRQIEYGKNAIYKGGWILQKIGSQHSIGIIKSKLDSIPFAKKIISKTKIGALVIDFFDGLEIIK